VQDNGIGVTGLAPGVKVQHLRVLGECGGAGADILAAVIWGSGGDLGSWFTSYPGQDPGTNATPASVLHLSLGGSGSCDVISQQVFDEARARGTTVVVAAGKESGGASSTASTSREASAARTALRAELLLAIPTSAAIWAYVMPVAASSTHRTRRAAVATRAAADWGTVLSLEAQIGRSTPFSVLGQASSTAAKGQFSCHWRATGSLTAP